MAHMKYPLQLSTFWAKSPSPTHFGHWKGNLFPYISTQTFRITYFCLLWVWLSWVSLIYIINSRPQTRLRDRSRTLEYPQDHVPQGVLLASSSRFPLTIFSFIVITFHQGQVGPQLGNRKDVLGRKSRRASQSFYQGSKPQTSWKYHDKTALSETWPPRATKL